MLHADMFKFHPKPTYQSFKYKLWTKLFILRIATDITIFTSTQEANEWTIYPWIHANCNSISDNDELRPISFPKIHFSSTYYTMIYYQCCRCFGSDHTPGVAPRGVFRSRTVSTTVAKWFVPIARGTMDKIYRFGPLRSA
jgi:hypothetical protein